MSHFDQIYLVGLYIFEFLWVLYNQQKKIVLDGKKNDLKEVELRECTQILSRFGSEIKIAPKKSIFFLSLSFWSQSKFCFSILSVQVPVNSGL